MLFINFHRLYSSNKNKGVSFIDHKSVFCGLSVLDRFSFQNIQRKNSPHNIIHFLFVYTRQKPISRLCFFVVCGCYKIIFFFFVLLSYRYFINSLLFVDKYNNVNLISIYKNKQKFFFFVYYVVLILSFDGIISRSYIMCIYEWKCEKKISQICLFGHTTYV